MNDQVEIKAVEVAHAHTILGVMCINSSTQQMRLSTAPHLIERSLHPTRREPPLPWLSLDQICSQMPKRLLEMLCASIELSEFSLLCFLRVHTCRRLGPAVEWFCLMDRARVEACFLSFQKGATLRKENSVSIVRVVGINRYVL